MYIPDYLLTKLQLTYACVVTEKHTLSSKLIKFNAFIEPWQWDLDWVTVSAWHVHTRRNMTDLKCASSLNLERLTLLMLSPEKQYLNMYHPFNPFVTGRTKTYLNNQPMGKDRYKQKEIKIQHIYK